MVMELNERESPPSTIVFEERSWESSPAFFVENARPIPSDITKSVLNIFRTMFIIPECLVEKFNLKNFELYCYKETSLCIFLEYDYDFICIMHLCKKWWFYQLDYNAMKNLKAIYLLVFSKSVCCKVTFEMQKISCRFYFLKLFTHIQRLPAWIGVGGHINSELLLGQLGEYLPNFM